ncbi:hypothetical protein KSS87_000440 [Heliosperma pusillum]|nr:hypothetical protein KSS87_000440 [Heliosperma pusillum]
MTSSQNLSPKLILYLTLIIIIFTFVSNSMAETNSQKPKVNIFNTKQELAISLADYTANLSEKFIKEKGIFTVVLSGGYLIDFLWKLKEAPYVESIDWSKWHVFWVDERVVPRDHPDSNYNLAFNGFLSKVPILIGNVYAINDALPTEGAAENYEARLKELVKNNVIAKSSTGFPKFDLMLLGMGPDGHVASLFPGHPQKNEHEKWVTYIKDSPKPPPDRITFTFPVINSASYNAFVMSGSGEAEAVKKVLGPKPSGEPLPGRLVSAEVEVKWFLDKDAAALLE